VGAFCCAEGPTLLPGFVVWFLRGLGSSPTSRASAALLGASGIAALGEVLAFVLLKKPADGPAADSTDSELIAA
jgi:hypothetical protein